MPALAQLRDRLRLRERLRPANEVKGDAELHWWLHEWDPVVRAGGFNPGDVPAFLDGEAVAETYEGRRWQQARAEVRRVLAEAEIEDADFFAGKVVLDIGPGALGFPDACPARVSIGVEPLAERFAQAGLLLESDAIYMPIGAERIPLRSDSVDVVLARNSLDHVEDPAAVIAEARRLLRPGGTLILNFDVGMRATATEPHTLSEQQVRSWLAPLVPVRERRWQRGHGGDGHVVIFVAEKPLAPRPRASA